MANKTKQNASQDKKNGAAGNKASPSLPLFYKNPMPLDAKKHADLSLKTGFNFSFAKTVNAVPINMVEMPLICHFFPIAFSPDATGTPVAILGLRDNENLFVDDKGSWQNDVYIPAYIRRYPFIFSEVPGGKQYTLCVDNSPEIVEQSDKQPFFDKESDPTQLTKDALEFCKSYHTAAQQTLAFGEELAKNDLLIEKEAQINIEENKRISFSGFRIIDEKKLAELDDSKFLEWRKKGWLPIIYAHLFSGTQWSRLSRLVNEQLKTEKS
ncbi:MAG: SapC family protein [Alphaproteobacteria bacterium]|nr:SapC family protein [Alphaproteobacteria bacterium]